MPSSSVAAFEPRDDSGVGSHAQLSAEVDVIGGCAVARSEEVGTVFIPIFPDGDDRIENLVQGERVELGGSGSGDRMPENSTIPDGCGELDESYWIVH